MAAGEEKGSSGIPENVPEKDISRTEECVLPVILPLLLPCFSPPVLLASASQLLPLSLLY